MERKQTVMAVVVVVLAVVFVFGQYKPLNKRAKDMKAANAMILAANAAADAHIAILPQLTQDIESMKKDIGDFDARIPADRSYGQFLQDLAGAMQKEGLGGIVVQPGTETKAAGLSQIPVSIGCEGKLVQIFRFFRSLESFERIIQLEEVSLLADKKSQGGIIMKAKINIFYRAN